MKAKELKILRKKLAKLNKADHDPTENVAKDLFSIINKNGDDNSATLNVRFSTSSKLSSSEFENILALFEKNMAAMYKESSWGLDIEKKTMELKHDHARYLLLECNDGKLAGFVHFRFDYDDEEAPSQGILYIYEIQIDEGFQRQGIGKKLMVVSEQIAVCSDVPKVMLTVFKKNKEALKFYEYLSYQIDESSPSKHNEPADYEILSKECK